MTGWSLLVLIRERLKCDDRLELKDIALPELINLTSRDY